MDLPRPRNGINTRIGFPTTYWKHGPSALVASMAVWLLVGLAVALMLATVGRRSGGPLLSVIALLVAAVVLLQTLPAAESGIQLIPLLPWQCSGLLPICLSVLCWAALLLAALVAVSGCLDAPRVFSAVVLFVMGINPVVSLGGG